MERMYQKRTYIHFPPAFKQLIFFNRLPPAMHIRQFFSFLLIFQVLCCISSFLAYEPCNLQMILSTKIAFFPFRKKKMKQRHRAFGAKGTTTRGIENCWCVSILPTRVKLWRLEPATFQYKKIELCIYQYLWVWVRWLRSILTIGKIFGEFIASYLCHKCTLICFLVIRILC